MSFTDRAVQTAWQIYKEKVDTEHFKYNFARAGKTAVERARTDFVLTLDGYFAEHNLEKKTPNLEREFLRNRGTLQ